VSTVADPGKPDYYSSSFGERCMKSTMSRITAVLFALPLSLGAAQAATISGTFTGTANYTQTVSVGGPPVQTSINGEAVTGSFTATTGPCVFGNIAQGCAVAPANNAITLNVAGQVFVFDNDVAEFRIENGPAGETLNYTPVDLQPYETADLVLVGAQDAFTDGLALDTLHPGPVDLAASSLRFAAGRSIAGQVQLTSLQFTPIPEPPGYSLLLSAALLVVLLRSLTPQVFKVVSSHETGAGAGRS
jgi:hypothetical protein